MVIQYMQKQNSPAQARWLWPLRYEMLLWLSLLCMIPFDLAQFDDAGEASQTADSIESLAKLSLDKAGLECDAAALVLSRFYMR
jgi:tubulin-specific chaperone D